MTDELNHLHSFLNANILIFAHPTISNTVGNFRVIHSARRFISHSSEVRWRFHDDWISHILIHLDVNYYNFMCHTSAIMEMYECHATFFPQRKNVKFTAKIRLRLHIVYVQRMHACWMPWKAFSISHSCQLIACVLCTVFAAIFVVFRKSVSWALYDIRIKIYGNVLRLNKPSSCALCSALLR